MLLMSKIEVFVHFTIKYKHRRRVEQLDLSIIVALFLFYEYFMIVANFWECRGGGGGGGDEHPLVITVGS